MYSSLRILLPPNASPLLTSSRFAHTWAPPRWSLSRRRCCSGLGPKVSWCRGISCRRMEVVYHRYPGAVSGFCGPVLDAVTPDLPAGLTARPLTPTDLDAAYAVYSGAEVEDSGHLAIEPEDIAGDWARPSFDLATDSIGVFDGERLIGAAEVTTG